jgi:MFS family permease
MRQRLGESVGSLVAVFRNRNLRRLELAWTGSVAGEWAYGVALAVYAYNQGGAAAVGIVMLLRYLSSAVVAPFAAILADRFPRERVMVVSDLARAAALGAAVALVAAAATPVSVYALAIFVSLVSTAFQPAQAAILPRLAGTPEELTAANVASSTIESVGSFLGPALGGLLLAVTSVEVVFAVTAGTFLWSAACIRGIRPEVEAGTARAEEAGGFVATALAGFRTIVTLGDLRLLVALYSAQTLVAGALNVFVVVLALDVLDLGEAGVGILDSAIGIGGLIGAAVTLALVGRRRLANDLGVGIVLWGAPIALIGVWPEQWFVLLALGIVGIGNTLVDVAALTLLQRTVPDEVLARVFGVLEALVVATIGIGAALAPPLIDWLGVETALVATGVLLPGLAVLSWRRLLAVDAAAAVPEHQLALLRRISIFGPLPSPTLEHLAASLVRREVPAGEVVIREGDPGDRFYVLEEGEVEVSAAGKQVATLGPGDWFGEIALLRDVPRTATVTAATHSVVWSLERDEFLAGVTGHTDSAEAVDAVVGARLAGLRAALRAV